MPVGRRTIVDAVIKGIAEANTRYEKMTGGWWLTDSGAEGYMVARVAETLHAVLGANETLLLEAPFDEIREWSGASCRRGRPHEVLRGRRRTDITLFDRQGKPTHVVEVKRFWNSKCLTDIERLLRLLDTCAGQAGGSLKHGLLGLLIATRSATWTGAKERVEIKAQRIEDDVKTLPGMNQYKAQFTLGRMRRYPECWEDKEEFAAAGFCIALSG